MANTVERVKHFDCLRLASRASCSAVRIYNTIREVGRGELTADNALHQLVEEYHNLKVLSDEISKLADYLDGIAQRSEENRSEAAHA